MEKKSELENLLTKLDLINKAKELYTDLGEASALSYIRSSYRLLSKVYHPDLNPKNKTKAENFQKELFSRACSFMWCLGCCNSSNLITGQAILQIRWRYLGLAKKITISIRRFTEF